MLKGLKILVALMELVQEHPWGWSHSIYAIALHAVKYSIMGNLNSAAEVRDDATDDEERLFHAFCDLFKELPQDTRDKIHNLLLIKQ